MRDTAGRLNRTWLAIIGLLVLLLGVAGLLLASGAAATVTESLNAGFTPTQPTDTAVPTGLRDVFAADAAPLILAVLAVLVGILALLWLLAQVPRRHGARTFRLRTDDGAAGYTRCEPEVLAEAVENHVQRLPGVTGANALLRGSATETDLNINVRVDDRTDLQDLLHRIHTDVAADLETALETPLRKLAVLITVGNRQRNDKTAVL
ncbi:hypothetical protein D6T63_18195 [Arthrobacter cheniae]|uniref:Alkaline shock response membrane anchor protein AmaP n=1 Tax=Arthrobacter cheniae TaxID=1258888 RepID=A0A3A5M2D1_9MICC|nr:hypothetical protein [Arthrobacter cheniae]RJT75117.1 hypothetical protein D6T63_18195 [Arthrobacter cheniae]